MDKTGIDWKGFHGHRHDPEAVMALATNISEYFKEPLEARGKGAKFQTSDSNLAGTAVPMVNVYANTAEEDFGYERLFDFVDMRQSTAKTFEILDAANGVTFEQVKEGEPAKIRRVTTSKTSVGYLKYMGGLGFLDDWFRFNQYYLMDDIIRDVRRKYYSKMAQVHYDLFTNLGAGVNEAFSTDDVTTINNACAAILKAIDGKGYAAGENPAFKIVAGTGLKARIAKALIAAFTMPNANNNQIVYRIDEVVATPKIADTSYYVMLPGVKAKRAVWDDLNSESQRDALRRAEDMTWEGKFNAALGDSDQIRRCALA
ncbi:MAG: hypothetical protein ACE5GY_09840 [Thermodesulfobacteriota bacterium]